MNGAPLRFLALVAMGWTGGRALMLWPGGLPLPDLSFATPLPPANAATISWPSLSAPLPPVARPAIAVALAPPRIAPGTGAGRPSPHVAAEIMHAVGYGAPPALGGLRYPEGANVHAAPAVWRGTPFSRSQSPARLSVSSWLIARPGGGSGSLVGGGQLGGSQAGVRASYALNGPGTLAVAARLSSPLASARGREAAVGFDWQPSIAIPVKLMAEHRFALDRGGRTAIALGLAGGIGGVPIAADFNLDAYAQAGIVGLARRDAYVDGAVRIERPVWRGSGASLSLGLGLWGAAQPSVSRLDVGPQAVVRLPTGATTLRLGLEWRQRVAGNARPGSGPALSLGADF